MFDEFPNRRITERRTALKDALIAIISLVVGGTQALRSGRVDWETLAWGVVFVISVIDYSRRRHSDPWSPPLKDSPQPTQENREVGAKG
jgi:hypothetical protein